MYAILLNLCDRGRLREQELAQGYTTIIQARNDFLNQVPCPFYRSLRQHMISHHSGGNWKVEVGDGQGSLACRSPWGHKDTTEWLNWLKSRIVILWSIHNQQCKSPSSAPRRSPAVSVQPSLSPEAPNLWAQTLQWMFSNWNFFVQEHPEQYFVEVGLWLFWAVLY